MPKNNYVFYPIRSAAILTTSFVAGTLLGGGNSLQVVNGAIGSPSRNNHLELYVDFTLGSLTNATIKVEFSNDGTNWYQETEDNLATSTGVITEVAVTRIFTATGKYRVPININSLWINANWIRISAEGVGTVTGSSLAISAVLGNV